MNVEDIHVDSDANRHDDGKDDDSDEKWKDQKWQGKPGRLEEYKKKKKTTNYKTCFPSNLMWLEVDRADFQGRNWTRAHPAASLSTRERAHTHTKTFGKSPSKIENQRQVNVCLWASCLFWQRLITPVKIFSCACAAHSLESCLFKSDMLQLWSLLIAADKWCCPPDPCLVPDLWAGCYLEMINRTVTLLLLVLKHAICPDVFLTDIRTLWQQYF